MEGRADGIIDRCGGEQEESGDIDDGFDMAEGYAVDFHDSDVLIDEIKGIYRNLDDMESPQRVHVAQAMCYAYIYSKENNYSWIDVRISYVNLDSEKEKFFRRRYSFGYLEKWFSSMMAELCKWIDLVEKHQLMRNQSISDMEFPFEYRKGQKEMALYVYRAIEQEKHLYVQAPTESERPWRRCTVHKIHGSGTCVENILSDSQDHSPHCVEKCGGACWRTEVSGLRL
ncbi:MAG: hypothetical protein ACLTDF_10090 [Coprococcus sp.]